MGFKRITKAETAPVEEWRELKNFPGYEISRLGGQIRVAETGEKLDLTHDGKGLRLVWLYDEHDRIDLRVVGNLWKETFGEVESASKS